MELENFSHDAFIAMLCFLWQQNVDQRIAELLTKAWIVNNWVNSAGETLKVPSINQWSFCCRRIRFSVVPNIRMRASSSAPESHRRKLVPLVDFCRGSGMAISFTEVTLAYGRSFLSLRRSIALCEAAYDGKILAVCNEIPSELCWIICLGLSTVVIALRRISATVFFASFPSGYAQISHCLRPLPSLLFALYNLV